MEINPQPLLSVIFVCRSGKADSLESALLSLIGQIYRPCEVILVMIKKEQAQEKDQERYRKSLDALNARWKDAFSGFKIIEMDGGQQSSGAGYAMGLKQASGQYINFMDDDHRIYPYTFLFFFAYLQEHPVCVWSFANIGVTLVNEHQQVIQRLDPNPTQDYVGVDYLEQDIIRPPGLMIDRSRLDGLLDWEGLLAKTSISEVIALMALATKPGHMPMLGGEIRQAQGQEEIKQRGEMTKDINQHILPWWLEEFQSQIAAQRLVEKPKPGVTLHQALVDEQSIYYRQLYMTYRQSTSGKIVRVLLRNYAPAKEIHTQIAELPQSELEAMNKILLLQSHPLWDLTAPVRWLGKWRAALK
jgi:hypothetical protein